MTKTQLIAISVIRDALDLIGVGQIPGLSWVLSAPIVYLHYRYAGPIALCTLIEGVPGLATLPFFTAAAMAYPENPVGPGDPPVGIVVLYDPC